MHQHHHAKAAVRALTLIFSCIVVIAYPADITDDENATERNIRRGVASGFTTCTDMGVLFPKQSKHAPTWYYNWGMRPKTTDQNNVTLPPCGNQPEFVPMQWSRWGIHQDLDAKIPQGATHLLGFNEPNHKEQANLSPKEAADLWNILEAVAKKRKLRLGGPSAARCGKNCVTRDEFQWWDEFMGNCTKPSSASATQVDTYVTALAPAASCKMDFWTVHYYGCSVKQLQELVEKVHMRYGKLPVWVTEIACPQPRDGVKGELAFMREALEFMDRSPIVERYAWFSTRTGGAWLTEAPSLLTPDRGALTQVGKLYVNQSPRPKQQFPSFV